jgi:NAD(P)-dependent dehydrogenase (short-subunit alcohol dehydrogenase family)
VTTTGTLAGKTMIMSGGSRGIGLAIALRAARDGANIALIAKTDQPDPRLPGTIHTAAAEIEAAGGTALPILGDVRNEDSVAEAVNHTVQRFGGIDIVVNNASAINLANMYAMTMLTLGVAESRREVGIAANCLWPRTLIATAAVQNLLGGDNSMAAARTPEIVADAAYQILIRPSRECTGNTFIDDEVLAESGVTDFSQYRHGDGTEDDLQLDIFL